MVEEGYKYGSIPAVVSLVMELGGGRKRGRHDGASNGNGGFKKSKQGTPSTLLLLTSIITMLLCASVKSF